MTVVRIEARTLRPGVEVAADLVCCGLPATFDVLPHDQPRTAAAGGKMDQIAIAFERGPFVAGDECLAAGAVVLATREIHEHGFGRLAVLRTACAKVRAEIVIELDLADGGRGCPVAFLPAGGDEATIRRDAEAVGIAEAGGEHFEFVTPRDAAHALIARGEIPAAFFVGFESDDEIVPARGGLHRIRHALVEIGFVIAIEIVQTGDLIATEDVELVLHDLHAQRLIQAGGEAFPAQLLQLFVDALHEPHLACHRRDGRSAIAEEIMRRDEEQRAIRILERDRDAIRGEGRLRAEFAFGFDPLRPLGGPPLVRWAFSNSGERY
jgi:hypothetical protein